MMKFYSKPNICPLIFFSLLIINLLNAQDLAINEVMSSNSTIIADEDGDFEDWLELYNYGSSPINLKGYGLSDNSTNVFKWVFPDVTIMPKEFLLVWASDKNRTMPSSPLHTNFKISNSGEHITLARSDGLLIDELLPTEISTNISYGRQPDGTGTWHLFSEATPNAPNNKIIIEPLLEPPVFSKTSGFFDAPFSLSITHPNPAVTIVYTTDGSDPSLDNTTGKTYPYKNQYPKKPGQPTGPLLTQNYTSNIYTNILDINDRSNQLNKLAIISSTIDSFPNYFPVIPIKKATIVRAKAFSNDKSSKTITNTYFVSETGSFDYSLPVVSISLNEDNFFDYNKGIYVAGIDYDNWRTANPSATINTTTPANYRRRGDEAEVPACFQYFVNNQEVINQNIGIKIYGSLTRSIKNKSLLLYARSEYDKQNSFDYPFFGKNDYSSFKRLILRISGNDHNSTFFRDAFMQTAVSHLSFDVQSYQPTITFINGEYWGLLNLRNRYDKHFIERIYGIKENDLDYLANDAVVEEGDNSHFLMMKSFVDNNDMTITENYNYVKTLLDIENFSDYFISEIYINNSDWPFNNIDFFRKRTSSYEPNAPYGHDGRWRYLMFDTDLGFGYTGSVTSNSLDHVSGSKSYNAILFKKLLENEEFKLAFINRFADLINTTFLPERLFSLINDFSENIASEIPDHYERWNSLGPVNTWNNKVKALKNFATARPEIQRSHILEKFDIDTTITVQLSISNHNAGYIHINTIDIKNGTVGVTDNPYPWTGIYFKDIPITLKAIAKTGYRFTHWSGANNSTKEEIILTPNDNLSIQANFEVIEGLNLLHFWLMDSDIPNDTPLESLTSSYSKHNIHAVINYQSSLAGYPFSDNHPNWGKAGMERRNSPTLINYRPEANNNLAFENTDMRGIQIKQPFVKDNLENTLIISFSSYYYEDIRFSFAAKDEGAANKVIIDYYDTLSNSWVITGMNNSVFDLDTSYTFFDINFFNVIQANNNPDFKIRIRFSGINMTADKGKRVTFNNIAIEGKPLTGPCDIPDELICDKELITKVNQEIIVNNSLEGGYPGTITWKITPTNGVSLTSGTGAATGKITFEKAGIYTATFTSTNNSIPDFCIPESVSCSKKIIVNDAVVGKMDDTTYESIISYPNPAMTSFTIGNPNKIPVENVMIYDINGKPLLNIDIKGNTDDILIDVKDLESSVYIIVITSEENITVLRQLLIK